MDKLAGIKTGDRVRVTMEATIGFYRNGGVEFTGDGSGFTGVLTERIVSVPSFQIERIETPLVVGDRVRGKVSGDVGTIRYIDLCGGDDYALIRWECGKPPRAVPLENLERVA